MLRRVIARTAGAYRLVHCAEHVLRLGRRQPSVEHRRVDLFLFDQMQPDDGMEPVQNGLRLAPQIRVRDAVHGVPHTLQVGR
jgi:hypothetical protein